MKLTTCVMPGSKMSTPTNARKFIPSFRNIWYEDAIGIPLYQQIVVRAYRDYVHGFVPNAMFTDDNEILKRLYKQ